MNQKIRAGYSKVDITPPLGVCMAGYFSKRQAVGVLDPLYAYGLCVKDDSEQNGWLLLCCDLISIDEGYTKKAIAAIEKATSFQEKNIILHCSHTHTGPHPRSADSPKKEKLLGGPDTPYMEMLIRKLADVAVMAQDDCKPCTVSVGTAKEDGISFIRRYLMKDGSVKTNPGKGNPDIIKPIGMIDNAVTVVEFARDDGMQLCLVNFSLHPDIVGGQKFSADYPAVMRDTMQAVIPNAKVLYVNGAAGDINHIDAMHPDRTFSGYAYSNTVGRILGAAAVKAWSGRTKIELQNNVCKSGYIDVDVPLRRVTDAEVKKAKTLLAAFENGSWKAQKMSDTADLAQAFRTVSLQRSDDTMTLRLHANTIGPIAWVGFPGEVFVDIGRAIRGHPGYKHVMIASCSNGSAGYFPTEEAFAQGGYEAQNNPFTPELEGLLVRHANELLDFLK